MNWIEKIKKNVLPVSNEKYDIRKALDEWYYEGAMYDVEIADETCELCDHPNIRYQFEIVNSLNNNSLLIGSECITRFNISVRDNYGEKLSFVDAKKKVNKDKGRLVIEARERSVLNTLIELASKDYEFDIESFIEYFKERKAFTPNQLVFLIWRLERANIEFKKSFFKLTIRRGREKEQLLKLEDWKLNRIWQCMSTSQRNFVLDNKKHRV